VTAFLNLAVRHLIYITIGRDAVSKKLCSVVQLT
jgi:hypothetical protein